MKLIKLTIKNYKNLDADLVHNSDLIAFIGNNGSGKSNILEAISHIFRSLYVSKYKVNFNYYIEYCTSKNNNVIIDKLGKEIKLILDGKDKSIHEIANYLPQKLVAIYSGEEPRLFNNIFRPFYQEFVTNINSAQNQGTIYSDLPKMLFLNSFYWNIALLCLLVSDSPDNKKFVEEVLKIKNKEKIKIKIDFIKRNYSNYNDNQALNLVRSIDSKSEYNLTEFHNLVMEEKGYTPDDIFKYLYLAYSPKDAKIINGITIEFLNGLTVSDLSEGEKKLLLIKGALEFAGQEDSIFILDEPDSHIHINNKEQITNSFTDYLHNRQIIITTHSPTLTQCVKDENVYMLNCGKIEDRNKQDIINEISGEFWNKHQQNSFISSKKPIILLVEGKHDKEHINNAFQKLKDEYQDLQFDIFNMNSACNIPPMMTGLRTSEIDYGKLIIGAFDIDEAGNKQHSETACGYPNDQNKKRHKEGYYSIFYPKHSEHKSSNFTVENLFDSMHLEAAYSKAILEYTGRFKGKSLETINDELSEKAKNILFNASKNFSDKEEFKHFRPLFNIIREIKNHFENSKVTSNQTSNTHQEQNSNPLQQSIINRSIQNKETLKTVTDEIKVYTEQDHTQRVSEGIQELYEKFKTAILNLSDSIEVQPKKDYIAFKKGKNITDITILKKSLKIWINLKKGQLEDSKNICEDVSQKGHWGNGDYQISVESDKDLEYIMSLVKQAIV